MSRRFNRAPLSDDEREARRKADSASATSSTAASRPRSSSTATYIVCSSVGLDVGGESIPYVAGWGEDGALDAIKAYASTIDIVAPHRGRTAAARRDRRPRAHDCGVGSGRRAGSVLPPPR